MKRPLDEEPSAAERASWYEVRDGRRHVVPYEHTYLSNAKGRWVGRRVVDVMLAEFPHVCDDAYLAAAMGAGRLRRNGAVVSAEDVFRRGDRLSHAVLRDEPSVPAADVAVLHEDDGLLVIDKPAGVPVHHAGRFRRNTLVEILQLRQPPPGPLHVLHRLARQTSGVFLLPKLPAEAAALSEAMRESRLRKRCQDAAEMRPRCGRGRGAPPHDRRVPRRYLARVRGLMEAGVRLVDAPVRVISADGATTASLGEGGKPAATRLAPLGHDGPSDTSLVLCEPLTGRTHQVKPPRPRRASRCRADRRSSLRHVAGASAPTADRSPGR